PKVARLVADGNETAHETVDGEALYYKWHEAEKAEHGHFEEPDVPEVRNIVVPLGQRPVVPELPHEAREQAGKKKQRHRAPLAGEEFGKYRAIAATSVDGIEEERKPHPYERCHARGREDQREHHAQEPEDHEGPEQRIRHPWIGGPIFSG